MQNHLHYLKVYSIIRYKFIQRNAMNGILPVRGFQRTTGWCEVVIRTDRSTRERQVMNQDGTARYSGQSRPDYGNLGGTAGEPLPLVPVLGTGGFIFWQYTWRSDFCDNSDKAGI